MDPVYLGCVLLCWAAAQGLVVFCEHQGRKTA